MLLGPIVDAPTEEWDRMVDLNIKGLMYVAHASLPHLIDAAQQDPRRVADLVNISSVAGRRVGVGGGVYQVTKWGVGTFSEALRQEVTDPQGAGRADRAGRHGVRAGHPRAPGGPRAALRRHGPAEAEDIADAIRYIVTRPRRVGVNEMLIRPTDQER